MNPEPNTSSTVFNMPLDVRDRYEIALQRWKDLRNQWNNATIIAEEFYEQDTPHARITRHMQHFLMLELSEATDNLYKLLAIDRALKGDDQETV